MQFGVNKMTALTLKTCAGPENQLTRDSIKNWTEEENHNGVSNNTPVPALISNSCIPQMLAGLHFECAVLQGSKKNLNK